MIGISIGLGLGSQRRGASGPSAPTITIASPTFSDDFNAYADGTRLVAGDPNANAGLVATNPGNLGWDALTSVTPTNARYNPIIFEGKIRQRTASAQSNGGGGGHYLLAPSGTLSGNAYAQVTSKATLINFGVASASIFGTDNGSRLSIGITGSTAGEGRMTITRYESNVGSTVVSTQRGNNRPRMGGTNGNYSLWSADETLTLLAVDGRAYVRRGPGFPIGPANGTAFTSLPGNRFGIPSQSSQHDYIDAVRIGPAPLFITVDETHRHWVPKKRASASDPITAGVGDETFTGTYEGTAPSKMQWALFDMGTGVVVKDWALVPDADFTAGSDVWSARLRSIPAGLNGRGAYAVGFRPVDASNETDPAWQCVSNREFYVSLNVGIIGQSNAARITNRILTGTLYPRVDGLMTYTKLNPPSLVEGDRAPNPPFWEQPTTSGDGGTCAYDLANYLADLYDLPVSLETLAIGGRSANVLGPIDVATGLAHPSSDWDYITTHHDFAGSAYDFLYLNQGEGNMNDAGGAIWAEQWESNLAAYRDPAFHGQPAGTVIPVLIGMTGRVLEPLGAGYTDEGTNTLRQQQLLFADTVADCYMAHSATGLEMSDTFHFVIEKDFGHAEQARRIRLTYDHLFNGGAYDGRGPIATSASRSGAVVTVSFDLNGASSLTTRNGTDQTLAGAASALTSWQVSDDDFANTLTISSAVQTGDTVVITLSADPGGPVKVRNHYGVNPDISSFPAGSYADGTFICMMPLVNPLTAS